MNKVFYFPNVDKIFISFRVNFIDLTDQHCAFIGETFIKNNSVSATQRIFHMPFGLGRHDSIPTQNAILLWFTNFRATGSTLK